MRGVLLCFLLIGGCDGAATEDSQAPQMRALGAMVFERQCLGCHEARLKVHKTGPYLAGLNGRKAGSLRGFAYSSALENSGLTWTAGTLDRFLTDPEGAIPGTAMLTEPVEDPEERAALVSYLLAP